MELLDIFSIIEPVINAFEQLDVPYYIGGSVTSSIHGIPRSTVDVDLVAALQPQQVSAIVNKLQSAYYLDAEMIREAISRQASFNLIHLETMLKIDVFILKNTAYDRAAFQRRRKDLVDEELRLEFYLASAEDIILNKLDWFRMGGQVSERQWLDVLGVLKVQREALDMPYLRHWAAELGLRKLLEQAFQDAGIDHPLSESSNDRL